MKTSLKEAWKMAHDILGDDLGRIEVQIAKTIPDGNAITWVVWTADSHPEMSDYLSSAIALSKIHVDNKKKAKVEDVQVEQGEASEEEDKLKIKEEDLPF